MKVPFLDFVQPYEELKAELDEAYVRFMRSAWYILGKEVEAFEQEFAALLRRRSIASASATGWRRCIWCCAPGESGRGTKSLFRLTPTSPRGWRFHTPGAKPVPVEPDARTFNLDPARIEAAITPRTKAIMPVHLYGQPADMDPIMEIGAETQTEGAGGQCAVAGRALQGPAHRFAG